MGDPSLALPCVFFFPSPLVIVVVVHFNIDMGTKKKNLNPRVSSGKALTIDSASSEPWYVYAGGMAAVLVLLKIAGDVASGVIESLDDEESGGGDGPG